MEITSLIIGVIIGGVIAYIIYIKELPTMKNPLKYGEIISQTKKAV